MKRKYCLLFIILFLSNGSSPFAQEKKLDKLQKGAILVHTEKNKETGRRDAVGTMFVSAPVELIWNVITDYDNYSSSLSHIKESKLVKRNNNIAWVVLKFENFWPLPDIFCFSRIEEDPQNKRITFQMEQGNLSVFYGSFSIVPYSQEFVQIDYRLFTYGGWNIALGWRSSFNRSLVQDQLSSLRKYVQLEKLKVEGKPENVMPPTWRKAFFFWKKEKPKEEKRADSMPEKK